jgi:uncharacterized membrane protein YsdA (DUF1294 family)
MKNKLLSSLGILSVAAFCLFFSSTSPALLFPIYLCILNTAAFIIMGYDKRIAPTTLARVPEAFLYTLSLLGGTAGIFCGMVFFRHKIHKKIFQLTLTVILILQISLFYFFRSSF